MRLWTLRFVCTGKDATAVLTHWYHHVALSPLYLQIGEVWFVMSCHPPGHLWSTWDIYFLTVVVLSSYPYARVLLNHIVCSLVSSGLLGTCRFLSKRKLSWLTFYYWSLHLFDGAIKHLRRWLYDRVPAMHMWSISTPTDILLLD